MSKKLLIVGAGASGLVALREALAAGIEAEVVEKAPRIGGVFDNRREGGAYDSTLLTVSNYFMAFSTFPPDAWEPRRYWTHHEYIDYLGRYVRHYDLERHVRFEAEARDVRLDGERVRATIVQGGRSEERVYDAAVICTGTHRVPKLPKPPGIESFPGEVMHSAQYKNPRPFEGRRVLCIGLGETGADVAHEVARVAADAMVSVRHYPSVVERYADGLPETNDAYTSRALHTLGRSTIQALMVGLGRQRHAQGKSPIERVWGDWLVRSGGLAGQWFTKNDIFFQDIVDGRLRVDATGIDRIEGERVFFRGGGHFDADVIVCCTGYRDEFPLADVRIDDVRGLYKHMIHPDLGARIALIGWARPEVGGVPTCSELQARYLMLLLTGQRTLPARAELLRRIDADRRAEEAHFCNSPEVRPVVPYVRFCDDLARLIGCHPLEDGRIRDPRLLARLWFGSLVGAQYRLVGPGAEPEAARALIERLPTALPVSDRVYFAALIALKRVPKLGALLERRAAEGARAGVQAHLDAHGGTAVMPGPVAGTIGE